MARAPVISGRGRGKTEIIFETPNLKEFVQFFENVGDQAEGVLHGLLIQTGWYMHRVASLREGQGGYMPYDTGTLQASLSFDGQVHKHSGMSYVAVTTNVHYAAYQEFGFRSVSGRDIPGKGFMRYGAQMAREYMEDEFRNAVKRLFEGDVTTVAKGAGRAAGAARATGTFLTEGPGGFIPL